MRKTIPLVSGAIVLTTLFGCGTATPTRAPVAVATQPPIVVTVVVTATPLPVTATPEQTSAAVSTSAATLQPGTQGTLTRVAAQPTATNGAPRPTNTRRPASPTTAPGATTAPPTAFQAKYPAPRLRGPVHRDYTANVSAKDERHFPGDALVFQWEPMAGVSGDECYMLTVTFKPGQGDTFLVNCGNAGMRADVLEFKLNQPNREGPNYGSLLPFPNSDTMVNWTVTVVKDLGVGSGPNASDGKRHAIIQLSPSSVVFEFPLKGS